MSPAAIATQTRIRQFSRDEDPAAAQVAAEIIGQAMSKDANNRMFCPNPDWYYLRWHAIAHNYQLSRSDIRMMYDLQGEAAAYAYWYPEEKGPEGAPDPPGSIDLTQWRRAEVKDALLDLLDVLNKCKARFLKTYGPFMYVAFLSTRPEHQGKGLGGQLLEHLTQKADAVGKWCYLEATNERNARLYERRGFVRLQHFRWERPEYVPGASANLILMARPLPGTAAPQPWGPTYVPTSSEALAGAKVVHLAGEDRRAEAVVNIVAQAMASDRESASVWCSDPANAGQLWDILLRRTVFGRPTLKMQYLLEGEPCAAIAYWYPAEKPPESSQSSEGASELKALLHPDAMTVGKPFMAHLAERKERMLRDFGPFFYLMFLGVQPDHQGKGLGGRMLAALCAVADAANKWTYLEATNENNARLYERHGFVRRDYQSWSLPGAPDGPKIHNIEMVRPPASLMQGVRQFSRAQDPDAALQAAATIGAAIGSDTVFTGLYCFKPEYYAPFWRDNIVNYGLKMPKARMFFTLQDAACACISYWWPDDMPADMGSEDETPEGGVDTSQYTRDPSQATSMDLWKYIKDQKQEFFKEHGTFLYIAFVGVLPEYQGQGLGRRMVEALCTIADAAGKWSYLEGTNERNAQLYERLGFVRRQHKQWTLEECPGHEATIITMARPPCSKEYAAEAA